MNYKEVKQDLFDVSGDYYFAQCISADFAMGAGIAVQFNKHFDIKNKLTKQYGDWVFEFDNATNKGTCLYMHRVFNLVTKCHYYDKPTYETMRNALESMSRVISGKSGIKIAMPLIGCGIDKLEWDKVSAIIKEVFATCDVDILVCRL